MKLFIFLLVFMAIVFGLVATFGKSSEELQKATQKDVRGHLVVDVLAEADDEIAEILDVRTSVEYDLGHIPSSNVFNVEWLKDGELPDIEKSQKIYVYCRSGNRSATAKEILENNGYSNVIDLGGISEWEDAGGQVIESLLPNYLEILAELDAKPIPPLGDEDAEITVVKYSDHSCPYCARYTIETEQKIFEKYTDVGKIKYEFKNVAYQGDESAIAAAAGYCANEYDAFWEFQTEMAQRYSQVGPAYYSIDNLTELAGNFGADEVVFRECLESGKYDQVVSSETLEARDSGFNSTPAFMVGEQVINGALPFEVFEATIDAQL